MKIIKLKNNGTMTEKDKAYFGGQYGFLERLKMGGIGSPRVHYKSGIPHFDELDEYVVETEIAFVNFELMKNGLLIRLNRNLKTRYIGIRLLDYKGVDFSEKLADQKYAMNLRTAHDGIFSFKVYAANLVSVQSFFNKKTLKNISS